MSQLQEVEAALLSSDPELRRRGVQLVPQVATLEQPRFLVMALGDEDWRVRKEAVVVSLELGPSDELIGSLVDALHPGDNVGLRNAAVETLAAFGAPMVCALADALGGLDADGRKLAAEALGRAHDAAALPVLEQLVADPDPNVRVAAIDHVAEVSGLSATRVLLSALGDDDVHVRLAALGGLSRLKATVPWEMLEALTSHPMLRASALALAGRSADMRAALALSEAIEDEPRSVFAVAVSGLAELLLTGKISAAVLGERLATMGARARKRLLEDALAHEKDEAHRAALVVAAVAKEEGAIDATLDAFLGERSSREAEASLRIFGPRALPRILARISEGWDEARAALVSLVVSLVPHEGDEAVSEALRLAIRDESPSVAGAALLALATLGGGADLSTIASLVSSRSPRVAVAAEAALASLAVRHPETARAFARDAVRDERSHLAAAIVIGAMGGGLLGALEDDLAFLARVLRGSDMRARRAAIVAVGDIGTGAGLDLAIGALRDTASPVRLAAVLSLGQLRSSHGRPVGTALLVELVGDDDPEIVVAALRALGTAGDPTVVPLLVSLVASPRAEIAVAAIAALGRIDSDAGLPALLEAGRSSEAEVVKAALLTLEGSNDPRALGSFGAALEHEAWDVRTLAADCLGPSGKKGALELLRDRLARETEPLVREALERAIQAAEARQTALS